MQNDSSNNNDEITVEGFAEFAKRGPILVSENDEIYYIKDFESWNDSVVGKKIKVKGKLVIEKDSIENENLIIQSFGDSEIKFLENITFKLDSIQDGSRANVIGTVLNFIEGARIYYGDIESLEFYQLEGIDFWDDSVCNKKVSVSGTVKFEKIIPYQKDQNSDMVHHYYQNKFIMKKIYDFSYELEK